MASVYPPSHREIEILTCQPGRSEASQAQPWAVVGLDVIIVANAIATAARWQQIENLSEMALNILWIELSEARGAKRHGSLCPLFGIAVFFVFS